MPEAFWEGGNRPSVSHPIRNQHTGFSGKARRKKDCIARRHTHTRLRDPTLLRRSWLRPNLKGNDWRCPAPVKRIPGCYNIRSQRNEIASARRLPTRCRSSTLSGTPMYELTLTQNETAQAARWRCNGNPVGAEFPINGEALRRLD